MFCCKLDVFPGHIRTLKSFAYEHRRAGWRNASASPGTQHLPNEGTGTAKGMTQLLRNKMLYCGLNQHLILSCRVAY